MVNQSGNATAGTTIRTQVQTDGQVRIIIIVTTAYPTGRQRHNRNPKSNIIAFVY